MNRRSKLISRLGIVMLVTMVSLSTVQLFAAADIDLLSRECPTKGDPCELDRDCGNRAYCYCNTFTSECASLHAVPIDIER
ncbi:MAG: hypothetical protein AAF560_18510 [Acidobacteriota bacterium]